MANKITRNDLAAPVWQKRPYIPKSNSIKHFSTEVQDLSNYLRASAAEEKCRLDVYGKVRSLIKACFPSAVVELYGSTATQMALPTSDIDVAILSGYKDEAPWYALEPFLRQFGSLNVQIISSSKVPVVKFVEPRFGFGVDISFGAPATGVESVIQWNNELERLKPLVLLVKYLLQQRGLHMPYTGGLGSFCVVVLMRHYLLSLQLNQGGLSSVSPMGPLLLGFLRYFGRFNYHLESPMPDGTVCPKSRSGVPLDSKQPWNLVLLNPLHEDEPVNCASSAFRMPEVAAMFLAVEKQLREAVNLDLSVRNAPYPTAMASVCYVDPALVQWRLSLSTRGTKIKSSRNPETGKPSRKMFKGNADNGGSENTPNQVQCIK